MLHQSKQKPSTLNFCESFRMTSNQLTPSTQNIISCFQNDTPTSFKYILDTPDKEDVGRDFTRHYKSIEEGYQMTNCYNNNCFNLEILNCGDEMHGNRNVPRPQPSISTCSSDIQSSLSSNENKFSSSSYNESSSSLNNNPSNLNAKKRERNRLAAEKCRIKKQRKIKELENEKHLRLLENEKLIDRVAKQTEKLKSLQIFYQKLVLGEIKPQRDYQ